MLILYQLSILSMTDNVLQGILDNIYNRAMKIIKPIHLYCNVKKVTRENVAHSDIKFAGRCNQDTTQTFITKAAGLPDSYCCQGCQNGLRCPQSLSQIARRSIVTSFQQKQLPSAHYMYLVMG